MQSWRLAKDEATKLATCHSIAEIIVEGCKQVNSTNKIKELGMMFSEFLNNDQMTSFDGKIKELTLDDENGILNSHHTEENAHPRSNNSIKSSVQDVDANRVLEYVCATGHLPNDDDEEGVNLAENAPLFSLIENFFEVREGETEIA